MIRLAVPDDYNAIHALEATASRELGSRYPARMKRSIEQGKVFVSVRDGQVVGFVEWNNPQRGKNLGWNMIYKIAVHPITDDSVLLNSYYLISHYRTVFYVREV